MDRWDETDYSSFQTILIYFSDDLLSSSAKDYAYYLNREVKCS